MLTETRQPTFALITVAAIGFAVGYFVSRSSCETEKRTTELRQQPLVTLRGERSTAPSTAKGSASSRRTGDAGSPGWEWVRDERSREFFAKIYVTRGDIAEVTEMEKRRAHGEYILQNERPTTRKFLDYDFREIVSQASADAATEYDQLFAEMGVASDVAEQLKTHLAKIHRASLEATVAIQQILQAREDYDKRLRSTLSEEDYQYYRQKEESKPAIREYQDFQNFANQQNTALSPEHEQALVGLIQTTRAYTKGSHHGPFDGLPQPTTLNAESVIPAEERNLAEITERMSQLLDVAPHAGLPEEYRTLLERYYAGKLQERRDFLEGLRTQRTEAASKAERPTPVRPDEPRP